MHFCMYSESIYSYNLLEIASPVSIVSSLLKFEYLSYWQKIYGQGVFAYHAETLSILGKIRSTAMTKVMPAEVFNP